MDKDYEKIGREFMEINRKYDADLKAAEGPREVYAIIDNFLAELRDLWLRNE